MKELRVPYSTWKQVAQTNSYVTYHALNGVDHGLGWCGTEEFIYMCAIDAEDYPDWNSSFPSSVSVESQDDAIAQIIGIKVHPPIPREDDGKQLVVASPSTMGLNTWFTGAGDHATNGRGEGTQMKISYTGPEDKEVEFQMNEPVEIHDGAIFYSPTANWTPDDRWDFFVRMPATVPSSNPGTTGNCNLSDAGGYNVIVPAAGDGTHDVGLSGAVPVPAKGAGYWDVDPMTGAVVPSLTPGTAKWHLLDIQIESYFLKAMPAGNPMGTFEIDAYRAKWVSERWKMVLRCNKASSGSGDIAAWLMCFREKSTTL